MNLFTCALPKLIGICLTAFSRINTQYYVMLWLQTSATGLVGLYQAQQMAFLVFSLSIGYWASAVLTGVWLKSKGYVVYYGQI